MIVARQARCAATLSEYTQLLVKLPDGCEVMLVPLAEAERRIVEAKSCTRPSALHELANLIRCRELEAYQLDAMGVNAVVVDEATSVRTFFALPARLGGSDGGGTRRAVGPGALADILCDSSDAESKPLARLRLAFCAEQLQARVRTLAPPAAAVHALPVAECKVPQWLIDRRQGTSQPTAVQLAELLKCHLAWKRATGETKDEVHAAMAATLAPKGGMGESWIRQKVQEAGRLEKAAATPGKRHQVR